MIGDITVQTIDNTQVRTGITVLTVGSVPEAETDVAAHIVQLEEDMEVQGG